MKSKFPVFIFSLLFFSYAAHSQLIQKIYTYAGSGTSGFFGDGANASGAEMTGPIDVALDGAGSLYISDHLNYRVRKVNAGGLITTIAGNGSIGNSGNGSIGTSARIVPRGVAVDPSNNLFISDDANCVIRKVNSTGIISQVAGSGIAGFFGDNGPATAAWFSAPSGITFDTHGNMYIADMGNHVIRKINTAGIISTVAGNHVKGSSGDGGQATAASLDSPYAVAVDRYGNIFIDDYGNNVIRRVDHATDTISTYAGVLHTHGYAGDNGAASLAWLDQPRGLAVDTMGNLYISDAKNNVVREVATNTIITTVVGNGTYGYGGDLGPVLGANLFNPYGLLVDAHGSIYIADANNERVRKTYYATLGVNNIGNPSEGIAVYPNPASYEINVTGLAANDKVCIYDMLGRQVAGVWEVTTSVSQTFGIGSLVPGMYLVKVWDEAGSNKSITRLVKE